MATVVLNMKSEQAQQIGLAAFATLKSWTEKTFSSSPEKEFAEA